MRFFQQFGFLIRSDPGPKYPSKLWTLIYKKNIHVDIFWYNWLDFFHKFWPIKIQIEKIGVCKFYTQSRILFSLECSDLDLVKAGFGSLWALNAINTLYLKRIYLYLKRRVQQQCTRHRILLCTRCPKLDTDGNCLLL